MSHAIDLARRLFHANRSGPPRETLDVALAVTDPHGAFRSRIGAIEGNTYDGHAGVHRYFADQAEIWREWRNDVRDISELRPGLVLVDQTFHAVGRESGMPIVAPGSTLIWVSGDTITRIAVFETREEALEAARSEAQRPDPR